MSSFADMYFNYFFDYNATNIGSSGREIATRNTAICPSNGFRWHSDVAPGANTQVGIIATVSVHLEAYPLAEERMRLQSATSR